MSRGRVMKTTRGGWRDPPLGGPLSAEQKDVTNQTVRSRAERGMNSVSLARFL